MIGKVLTYSPKDVTLILCGLTLGGIVSISVKWNTPDFITVRGAYGKNTRIKSLDTGAVVTLELLQTSVSNTILDDIVSQDAFKKTGRVELTLKDGSGNSLLFSDDAFVAGKPDFKYSTDFDNRMWEITLSSTQENTQASNEKTTTDIFSTAVAGVSSAVSGISDKISSLF